MSENKIVVIAIGIVLTSIVLAIAFYGTIAFVLHHFIAKYW